MTFPRDMDPDIFEVKFARVVKPFAELTPLEMAINDLRRAALNYYTVPYNKEDSSYLAHIGWCAQQLMRAAVKSIPKSPTAFKVIRGA